MTSGVEWPAKTRRARAQLFIGSLGCDITKRSNVSNERIPVIAPGALVVESPLAVF